ALSRAFASVLARYWIARRPPHADGASLSVPRGAADMLGSSRSPRLHADPDVPSCADRNFGVHARRHHRTGKSCSVRGLAGCVSPRLVSDVEGIELKGL